MDQMLLQVAQGNRNAEQGRVDCDERMEMSEKIAQTVLRVVRRFTSSQVTRISRVP